MTTLPEKTLWTPEDIAEVRELAAKGETDADIGARLNRSRASVAMMRMRQKIPAGATARERHSTKPPAERAPRPAPEGFEAFYMSRGIQASTFEFHASHATVKRWADELGLVFQPTAQRRGPRQVKHPTLWTVRKGAAPAALRSTGDHSLAGAAAHFLRRMFSNVFRCSVQMKEGSKRTWGDDRGLPDRGANHYCVDGRILTTGDLIDLAEQHGYSARWAA